MSNNVRLTRGLISRVIGISAVIVILFESGCYTSSALPAVSIALSPAGPVTLEQGGTVPLTATVTNYIASAGVTWTLTGAGSLTGITVTAVTYNAPASITAASTATVKATSVADTTKSASFTVNLVTPPVITSASLPNGSYNTAYGPDSITATGGFAPYSFGATGLPTGMTLSSSGSLSGTPTQAGSFSVVITVTDSESTPATATATLTLTITVSPLVLSPGTGNLPNATQNAAYTTSITPSGGIGPYTITLDPTSAALPAGLTFNGTTASTTAATITGTPTTLGTTSGIVVDVVDSESPAVTTKVTYSLTVVVPCGSGNESLLSGQYAFELRGFDSAGSVVLIGGVLTADGAGNLTAGAVDMNLGAGVSNLTIASGSTYQIGSDGRGCMAITTTAGTQNYRFSLAASGNGHMIDFDAGPFTTGVLRKQTASAFSTAQISGDYAFGISSPQDSAQGGGKFGAIGVLNLSAGSVNSSTMDYNRYNASTNTDDIDGSTTSTTWPALPISVCNCGSYTVNGTNGRGMLTFTPIGSSALNAYIYVVSASEVLIVSSDPRTVNNPFAGTAFLQSGGPYSTSSLNGKSVIYNSGFGSNGGMTNSSLSIGIVNTSGSAGTFSFTGYSNGGGSILTPTNNSASGTFSVDPNGRVTLTVTSGGGNQAPEFYLYSPGNAFALFSGSGVDDGFMELQSTTSAANATYSSGGFNPQTAGVTDKEGVVTLASGNASSTDDSNAQGTLTSSSTNTYSVDPTTGVLFLPASCTPGTNCEKIGAVVSGSKIIMMDAKSSSTQGGTTNPTLQDLEQ